MTTMRWLRLMAVVILCSASPRGAMGQALTDTGSNGASDRASGVVAPEGVTDGADDRAHGRVGNTVRVFLHEGRSPAELVGPLLRFGPEALTILLSGAPREISLADVVRVDVAGDSLKNGAIIGAVILGGWCAVVCGQGLSSAAQLPLAVMVNAGVGALIGSRIDAGHAGQTTIYQRPVSAVNGVTRLPSVARAGLTLSVRF